MDVQRPTTSASPRTASHVVSEDDRVFRDWIDEHRPRLLAVATRLAHGAVGAEDIVQEASLIAYERRHTLRDPGAAGAWLAGIVRNVGCQVVRKHSRQTALLDAYREKAAASCVAGSEGAVPSEDAILTRVDVRRAVGELPEIQRSVVICRWFEDMSHKEIAAFLGREEGTVRSDLCRAHEALRKKLG